MKLRILILLFGIITFIGCSEDTLNEPNSDLVVVTGFLKAGEKNVEIKLTNTLELGSVDTVYSAINDADVTLLKGTRSYKLSVKNPLSGVYSYSGSDLSIESGDLFSLQINYKNKIIKAETVVPNRPQNVTISKPTLTLSAVGNGMGSTQDTTSIYLKWSNPDSSLYYVVLENIEPNPTPIYADNTQRGANRITIFPPMATNQFLIARRNLTYLGNHRAIVYKVNQEYADLYESRTQDSRNLNEPITNVQNGLGVFSAFASDTTKFYVKIQ